MSLRLGKTLNRSYNIRILFLDRFYNLGIYFNKYSSFLLFDPEQQNNNSESNEIISSTGIKLSMFKNLKMSKFCETFLDLYSYKNDRLDILDQFNSIREGYQAHLNYTLNETIILSKINIDDNKTLYDSLTIYGFTIIPYEKEFLFLLAERQNIMKKINKKIVRTTGIQIATSNTLKILDEFYEDLQISKKTDLTPVINKDEIIKFGEL